MNTFALVGSPNSGKSTLFNSLTGKNQKVANYPGATVESAVGQIGHDIHLIDLPGLYGLKTKGIDEQISRDYIIQNSENRYLAKLNQKQLNYHTLLVVADATKLKRSLYLCCELIKLGLPIYLLLNRSDLSKKRNQKIDIAKLSQKLGIPILETCSFDENSINKIKKEIELLNETEIPTKQSINKRELHKLVHDQTWSKEQFDKIDLALKESVIESIKPHRFTDRMDNIATHPFYGGLFLLGVLYFIFQMLFTYASPFADGITWFFDSMGEWVSTLNLSPMIESFLIDGAIAGVGGTLVFLPQIAFLFFFIGLLEESGYMSRIAYLLDSLMMKFGLPGRSIIPLLSSHACAIPGIMAARSLSSHRDRLVTILVAPLTTCSARLPVYILLLATFLPLEQQGLGLLALYIAGIASSFLVAWILKLFNPPSNSQHLLMELPPYQKPRIKEVLKNVYKKSMMFIKKAGTVILFLTIVLWALTYFPKTEEGKAPEIEQSYAGTIGKVFTPIFEPLGMDVRLTTALIPAFAAREVMIASMGTVLSVSDPESDTGLENLREKIRESYPLDTILALIAWFIFAPQCISTFAVIKRETGGYKWMGITIGYTLALAYSVALFVKIIF